MDSTLCEMLPMGEETSGGIGRPGFRVILAEPRSELCPGWDQIKDEAEGKNGPARDPAGCSRSRARPVTIQKGGEGGQESQISDQDGYVALNSALVTTGRAGSR